MSKSRITKKELKEDAFVTAAFEAGHFFKENMLKIVLGAVGLLVLVGGSWLYVNYRSERITEASLELFKAESIYMGGNFAVAATDFDRVADDYSGTPSAAKALFFAGDSYYKAGQYDQAKERFEKARKQLSNSDPLKLNSVAGLAAVAEQQGDPAAAAGIYREAVGLAHFDYEKVILMGDLSRALEVGGQTDEALKVMDEIVEKYPDSPRTPLIKEHRAEVRARMQSGQKG
ncbi:tetratricopeptide repeat protein [bacterium]|nr:tetratricopeptide repeat protein [bacterium]